MVIEWKAIEGLVVKAMSGYAVVFTGSEHLLCQPRGRFKLEGSEVLSGDRVLVKPTNAGRGVIVEVLPRSTCLRRPPVANVSRAVVVFTLKEPPFDPAFLDRLLAAVEMEGIRAVLCLNKTDLLRTGEADPVLEVYSKAGYVVYQTSAITCQGVDALKRELSGEICVLAGQSGVGKSRLAACIKPGAKLKVGDVRAKTGRGRHTTKWVELLALEGGGWLADTPGFTRLDLEPVDPSLLDDAFPEISHYAAGCRFPDCLHRVEPDCAVVSAVRDGRIAQSRYESYLSLLGEVTELWKDRYS